MEELWEVLKGATNLEGKEVWLDNRPMTHMSVADDKVYLYTGGSE